jgi:hypothetical protein
MNTWTKICQANLEHYNNHPTRHKTIIVAYAGVLYVGAHKLGKRLAKNDAILRSGMMA